MCFQKLYEALRESGEGSILLKQTTYVEVAVNAQRFRINYHHKREARFVGDTFDSVSIFTQHPLLLEYTEPMLPVHLASHVQDKALFREVVVDSASEVFGKWRAADRYLNMPLDKFLKQPYGLLMTAPETYASFLSDRVDALSVKLVIHEGMVP